MDYENVILISFWRFLRKAEAALC